MSLIDFADKHFQDIAVLVVLAIVGSVVAVAFVANAWGSKGRRR